MLRLQNRQVSFPGGLDVRLMDAWVIDQLKTLRIKEIFVACDTKANVPILYGVRPTLNFLDRRQLRCYVLIAYNDETIPEAHKRLEAVWNAGFLPFAQLYQPPDRYIDYSQSWETLARTWSRPAAMFAMHTGGNTHGEEDA